MSYKITALADTKAEYAFDADTPEGREAVREFRPHYNQDPDFIDAMPSRLDYETWLPFAAKTYQISPNIEDYALVVSPICPADLPNRNGVAFPLAELKKFPPPPANRMVYKCWSGCPMHLEHDNEDCTKAYGVVLDASLHKVTGYGGGKLWKVMGLFAIDKTKYPDVAQQVISKQINTYSMGAMADYFTCSFCGSQMDRFDHCQHLNPGSNIDFYETSNWDGERHLVFRNAHSLSPIEVSIVKDPAWAPALSDHFLPAVA
ncbi:hypothetical protein D3C87_1134230 [compost metagenome]